MKKKCPFRPMVLYTLLLHTCTTGTIGICTIDFKITYILDTSSIFMFVATIEIMQSTTKSWYVVNFLMLYFVHCCKSFRSKLGWWFGTFYSQTVVFMRSNGTWVKDIDCLLLCIDQRQESRQSVYIIRIIRYTRTNQNKLVAYCRFIMYRNRFRSHTSWE